MEHNLSRTVAAASHAAPARTHGAFGSVRRGSGFGRVVVVLVAAGLAILVGTWPASAQVSPPTLSSVDVDGPSLTLSFSESLGEASVPPATSFVVTTDGIARDVSGVDVTSHVVTLTLATAVQAGQSVRISYTVPSSNPIRGASFIPVAAIADEKAANATSPRAPVLSGASIDGLIVKLTYDEYLDTDSAPPASSFSVTADGTARQVVSPTIASTYVRLVVTPPVEAGQSVQISYSVPSSNPIQDLGGTSAGAYTSRAVHNTTSVRAPVLSGASVDGSAVRLVYSEDLDTGSTPPASSFTFEVDGTERAVTGITMDDTTVSLTIAGAVQAGQSTSVSYAVPSSSPIQSLDGVFAGAYTYHAVPNYTISQPPVLQTTKLDASGLTITLTYQEDLDTSSTPPTTSFRVTVGGVALPVAAAAASGRTVVLVLESPVLYGAQSRVYVSYTAASSNPIRDIGGTSASAVTNRLVDRSAIRPVDPPVDPPVITTTSKTAFAYRENGTAALGTFRATDPEKAVVAWSVSGTDSDDFAISGTGVLSFAGSPDFENPADADRDNVYEVTVVAADDDGHAGTLAVTVTVTDQSEGPEVSGPQSLSFAENQVTDRVLASFGAVRS